MYHIGLRCLDCQLQWPDVWTISNVPFPTNSPLLIACIFCPSSQWTHMSRNSVALRQTTDICHVHHWGAPLTAASATYGGLGRVDHRNQLVASYVLYVICGYFQKNHIWNRFKNSLWLAKKQQNHVISEWSTFHIHTASQRRRQANRNQTINKLQTPFQSIVLDLPSPTWPSTVWSDLRTCMAAHAHMNAFAHAPVTVAASGLGVCI